MTSPLAYLAAPHVDGIQSISVDNGNGLRLHVLEAGEPTNPTVLLLHGFPEIAYSWRKVMPRLAAAGFHVIAPDQRGYGRTHGWDARYNGDLRTYHLINLTRDIVGLLEALSIDTVEAVVGHDFGASVAAMCALVRPDRFARLALMSAPYSGPPALQTDSDAPTGGVRALEESLAALPRPRKHYHSYYATAHANAEMHHPPQGLHDFLRAYFHHKSADWSANQPFPLAMWSADVLAQLPTYYVMDAGETMAEGVAKEMPSAADVARCAWLTDAELAVYTGEYQVTGFQGGLHWYRARLEPQYNRELQMFAGQQITVPAAFISGRQDWGVHQTPGAFEAMQASACTQMRHVELIEGAGHWVQQEQAVLATEHLLRFLADTR